MGNKIAAAAACEKCEPSSAGSVVNLSDDCVNRLTGENDIDPKKMKTILHQQEANRMEKLRCIDNAHSLSYGLSRENFEVLANRVERLSKGEDDLPCARTKLISCLTRNKFCISKCRKLMDEFIDCVDVHRINKIKDKIEEQRLMSRKRDAKNIFDEASELE